MAKAGKKFRAAEAKVNRDTKYAIKDAVALAKELSFVKFDESVDVAINLGVDPRHADQMVRGAAVLPHGLGKTVRVVVFAQGDQAKEATAAGAEHVGAEDLVEKILGGWTDFDACIATPDMMKHVGKLGRVLGPRGLMPNPKVGTVTLNVGKAVNDMKAGRVEFRVDKAGIIHAPIGRRSFPIEKLVENVSSLYDIILRAKPSAAKGTYVKGVTVSTTMGPGIDVDPSSFVATA